MIELTERELCTMLAALRRVQEDRTGLEGMDHFIDIEPLSNNEIDTLIEEKLNATQGPTAPVSRNRIASWVYVAVRDALIELQKGQDDTARHAWAAWQHLQDIDGTVKAKAICGTVCLHLLDAVINGNRCIPDKDAE